MALETFLRGEHKLLFETISDKSACWKFPSQVSKLSVIQFKEINRKLQFEKRGLQKLEQSFLQKQKTEINTAMV